MRSYWMLFLAVCPLVFAQREDRLNGPIDSRRMVAMCGRNPRTEAMRDEGALEPETRVRGIGFRFRPPAERLAELEHLLRDQQDPASPRYHAWLTPEEFGDRFGLSQNDLARVRAWIEGQGFMVEYTARSRTYITFSGSAEQVRETFRTELHRFRRGLRTGYANISDVHVPADLEPLIYTLTGLDELPSEPRGRAEPMINAAKPDHLLGPGDLATIYNVTPLLQKGFNGSGQKIVVAGMSAIKLSDIQAYRSLVGLPKNDPTIILTPGSAEPGVNDELAEATSDVEIAGASAPNASVIFVYGTNVILAAAYAIDQGLAPVVSYSYGGCEAHAVANPADMAAGRLIAQQANAQGITWVTDAGDSGPADCEHQRTETAGSGGMWVELPASYPEVTGVGGTVLAEGTGKYWSDGTGWGTTALSYIPEAAWNDTLAEKGLAASGGGASKIFPKPSWQTGAGIPNVNARMVPDISFAASWRHDPYLIVTDGTPFSWGGTSASTPFFAGLLAILNQYVVATGAQPAPGLGNINPRLYELARTTPGAFHDITAGDNIVPCKPGTPDCTTGQYGYTAGPGWDAATGLGSLDVNQFVLNWPAPKAQAVSTSTSVTAEPATISAAASTTLTASVKAEGGGTLPAGPVLFTIGQTRLGSADLSQAGGSGIARLVINGNQLTAGINTITASFGGSSFFSPSAGTATVTVTPAGPGRMSLSSLPAAPRQTSQPDSYCTADYPVYQEVLIEELNGKEVRLTKFIAGGMDLSAQIQSLFGSLRLAPFGALWTAMCWKIDSFPANRNYEIDGIDSEGMPVSTNLQVIFEATRQNSGRLAISKGSLSFSGMGGTTNTSMNVTVPEGEPWSLRLFPAKQTSRWLRVSPQSGKGPAEVTITASSENMSPGIYVGHLIFESGNTLPQFVDMNVDFLVGNSTASSITGAQNAASFRQIYAPGMLMSIYGKNLANTTRSATSVPLPSTMDGVTATVSGKPAPLWYISPGQINIQIPYETPTGSVTVVVNNNGQVSWRNIDVTASAPGIFNYSGNIVPVSAAKRGAVVSIYVAGDGETTPMLDTGAPPPAGTPIDQLPKPILPVTVKVAGMPAQIKFIGNPFLVGVTQINFEVPANAPVGAQPVIVTVGNTSSAAQTLVVQE